MQKLKKYPASLFLLFELTEMSVSLPSLTAGLNVPRCIKMGDNVTDLHTAYNAGAAYQTNGK